MINESEVRRLRDALKGSNEILAATIQKKEIACKKEHEGRNPLEVLLKCAICPSREMQDALDKQQISQSILTWVVGDSTLPTDLYFTANIGKDIERHEKRIEEVKQEAAFAEKKDLN